MRTFIKKKHRSWQRVKNKKYTNCKLNRSPRTGVSKRIRYMKFNIPFGKYGRKFKKPLLIIFGALIILVSVIILFISLITKYLIEKYDEQYTGRQITLDWAYTNPFTGYIHLNNLEIFEHKSDSVFFSAEGVSANFSLLKLF